MNHPLLDVDYAGASGALIQVIGGDDMRLDEIDLIGGRIQSELDPKAQVIWGARILPEYRGKIQVITVVTGVKSAYVLGPTRSEEVAAKVGHELGIEMLH